MMGDIIPHLNERSSSMRPEGNENYEAIISELKKIADDYDKATTATEMKEAIDRLKPYIPDTPIEVMNAQLEELAKPAEDGFDRMYRKYSESFNADEVINNTDFAISPRFVTNENGEPTGIHSFSIVHDRMNPENHTPFIEAPSQKYYTVRPILYSQWLKQMMMRAYGYQAGIINYFPRSIGLGKIGCSWWWQKLAYRRLASILCGDYYTPYDLSGVNLESVIYMSTYEALPKAFKRGCITIDSMNTYGSNRPVNVFIESWCDIDHPSYGKYLDNLEVKWPWSPWVLGTGLYIETPSSKLKEALSKNETHDKNVSTKHKKR